MSLPFLLVIGNEISRETHGLLFVAHASLGMMSL